MSLEKYCESRSGTLTMSLHIIHRISTRAYQDRRQRLLTYNRERRLRRFASRSGNSRIAHRESPVKRDVDVDRRFIPFRIRIEPVVCDDVTQVADATV